MGPADDLRQGFSLESNIVFRRRLLIASRRVWWERANLRKVEEALLRMTWPDPSSSELRQTGPDEHYGQLTRARCRAVMSAASFVLFHVLQLVDKDREPQCWPCSRPLQQPRAEPADRVRDPHYPRPISGSEIDPYLDIAVLHLEGESKARQRSGPEPRALSRVRSLKVAGAQAAVSAQGSQAAICSPEPRSRWSGAGTLLPFSGSDRATPSAHAPEPDQQHAFVWRRAWTLGSTVDISRRRSSRPESSGGGEPAPGA